MILPANEPGARPMSEDEYKRICAHLSLEADLAARAAATEPAPLASRSSRSEFSLEALQEALRDYMTDKVSVNIPSPWWIESGTTLNKGEKFAALAFIYNMGGIIIGPLRAFIYLDDSTKADLYVPYNESCWDKLTKGKKLTAGAAVKSMWVNLGQIDAYPPYTVNGHMRLIHIPGKALAAGKIKIRVRVTGNYHIAGLASVGPYGWCNSPDYLGEQDVVD